MNCGHPHAYVADADGNVEELEGPIHPPLGSGDTAATFTSTERRLSSDDRLILVTDGITARRTEGGGRFGVEGIRRALEGWPEEVDGRDRRWDGLVERRRERGPGDGDPHRGHRFRRPAEMMDRATEW